RWTGPVRVHDGRTLARSRPSLTEPARSVWRAPHQEGALTHKDVDVPVLWNAKQALDLVRHPRDGLSVGLHVALVVVHPLHLPMHEQGDVPEQRDDAPRHAGLLRDRDSRDLFQRPLQVADGKVAFADAPEEAILGRP